jgi:hypothetical protein
MKMNRFTGATIICITWSICLLVPPSAIAEDTYYMIEVNGGPDADAVERLKTFYSRLLAELKVDDLGYANVGCDNCKNIGGARPPLKSLTFAMEPDSTTLVAFTLSYHFVQENMHHELFTMTINGETPAGVCPDPLPTGCRPRPICIDTSSCDKPYGGPCAKCQ